MRGDDTVIAELTMTNLQAEPFRLIGAVREADAATMTAFVERVDDWGGDGEAVRALLAGLVRFVELHAGGEWADDELLDALADAITAAGPPSRPAISRVTNGYRRGVAVAREEAQHRGYNWVWSVVLEPLVDLILAEADRIGSCAECGVLFVRSPRGPHQRYCTESHRQLGYQHRKNRSRG